MKKRISKSFNSIFSNLYPNFDQNEAKNSEEYFNFIIKNYPDKSEINQLKGFFLIFSLGIRKLFVKDKNIINKPEILLLDEPTASLDPDIGDYVRSYVQSYKSKNKVTILLASHNMAEVERLCDSVIMMKKGKIIDQGTSKEIINRHGRTNLEETFLKIVRSKDEVA